MGSLGFVLGTAAVDHQEVLVDQLFNQLKTAPQEDIFFYIVPNHIKFETEISVLAGLRQRSGQTAQARFASNRVQVLSFSRLAWYLLRDTPAFHQTQLSKIGLTMLVTKITQEHADELSLYASEVHQPGFIQKLADQLTELQSANITADDFSDIISKIQANPDAGVSRAWLAKMHDVEVIYHAYEQRVLNRFLGNSELYRQLASYLAEQAASRHMHFFLDRFAQFTASEQVVVNAIIENAATTTISLTLDRGYPDQNHPNPSELPAKNDLFYTAAMQYHRLWKFAQARPERVHLLSNVVFADRLRVTPTLQEVDHFFKRYAQEPIVPSTDTQEVTGDRPLFITTPNRLIELNSVATMIRQLVATGKYRYRDFLILTRHLDPYQAMLAPVFNAHQVPIFNDQERRMDQHPLATLLTTLLQIPVYGYKSAIIIQLLKTWLLLPTVANDDTGKPVINVNEAVFTTENWCLMHGIEGRSEWKNEQLWQVKADDLTKAPSKTRIAKTNEQLKLIRGFVVQTLFSFFDQLKKASTGRELATSLYNFLTQNGITDRLLQWQNYQAKNGNLDLAERPKQVWATFCQILQEYVDILGETPVDGENYQEMLTNFSELLQAGFAAAQYSQIPATLDQVVVSETGITQSQAHKIVFVIGATGDVMPEMREDDGLLTDADKELLSTYLDSDFQYLPATASDQLANEPFLNYQGFLSAKERLILTVPQNNSEGQELTPSPYLVDMATYFNAPWENFPLVTSTVGQQNADLFVSSPAATLSRLVQVIRQRKDDQLTDPLLPGDWQTVNATLQKLAEHDEVLNQRYQLLISGQPTGAEVDDNIGKEMAAALYLHDQSDQSGQQILYASISQLETYYTNKYEYFLKYGLRLHKRERLSLSTDRVGTFFHKAMEVFINEVNRHHLSLAELSAEQRAAFTQLAFSAAEDQQPDLKRITEKAVSAQAAFQYQQLQNIVKQMFEVLCQQAKYAGFVPKKTEVIFGGNKANLVDYSLGNNRLLRLRGRIDRIDETKLDQQTYRTVVDYKSGDRHFDLVMAYYGVSLQLLTYLNALKKFEHLPNKDLAGALYLHLYKPVINANKLSRLDDEQKLTAQLQELTMKAHQYKGILVNDDDNGLLQKLDSSLGKENFLYPLSNRGGLHGNNNALLVSEEQLKWLLERNEALLKGAGNGILNGEISFNPYRLIESSNRRTGLDYSDYLDIYQFDRMIDQGKYNDLNIRQAQDEFKRSEEQPGSQDDDSNKGEKWSWQNLSLMKRSKQRLTFVTKISWSLLQPVPGRQRS